MGKMSKIGNWLSAEFSPYMEALRLPESVRRNREGGFNSYLVPAGVSVPQILDYYSNSGSWPKDL